MSYSVEHAVILQGTTNYDQLGLHKYLGICLEMFDGYY
jgi:hypothetical protein